LLKTSTFRKQNRLQRERVDKDRGKERGREGME